MRCMIGNLDDSHAGAKPYSSMSGGHVSQLQVGLSLLLTASAEGEAKVKLLL